MSYFDELKESYLKDIREVVAETVFTDLDQVTIDLVAQNIVDSDFFEELLGAPSSNSRSSDLIDRAHRMDA